MEIGLPIKDLEKYNSYMGKSIEDKLFFVPHLPQKDLNFVDFGCADGRLLGHLYSLYEYSDFSHQYIGYDCSEAMIDLAKSTFTGEYLTKFTTSWNEVMNSRLPGRENILILSSVIHEVYSYAKLEKDIFDFWTKVTQSGFDYIVIRDMIPASDLSRPTNPKLLKKLREKVYDKDLESMVYDFENRYGSIEDNKNFTHFLLKYRWRVNWKRELGENYFPITVEDLINGIASYKTYNLDYMERFRVPYLDECIKRDFGIELNDYTHTKAIFSKSKE